MKRVKSDKFDFSLARRMGFSLFAAIIIGEIIIMSVVNNINFPSAFERTVADALLLALLVIPVVYYIVVIPLRKQIRLKQEATEALRNSEANLQTIIYTIPDYVWLKSPDGVFLTCNKMFTRFFGASEQEIIGKTDYDFVEKELADFFRANDMNAVREKRPVVNEEWITLADGEMILLETIKTPVYNSNGLLIGVLGIGRDITARHYSENEIREKNEQLVKIQMEKDKFFSVIVHDIKTPFNSFLGLTDYLSQELVNLPQDELREVASALKSSAENLHILLEDMLVWARMERGMIPYNPRELILAPVLKESTEPLLELASSKNIELKCEVEPYETVYADRYLLQTIFRNLISNALKFTHSGGVVTVSAARKGGMVEISVQDSGIGITPEMKKNLFKFMSVNNRKGTEGEPSTGLGLVVCKDFAEKMGGNLDVESVPDSGSRFFFTLPANHPDK